MSVTEDMMERDNQDSISRLGDRVRGLKEVCLHVTKASWAGHLRTSSCPSQVTCVRYRALCAALDRDRGHPPRGQHDARWHGAARIRQRYRSGGTVSPAGGRNAEGATWLVQDNDFSNTGSLLTSARARVEGLVKSRCVLDDQDHSSGIRLLLQGLLGVQLCYAGLSTCVRWGICLAAG
jgi:hypothetical protein